MTTTHDPVREALTSIHWNYVRTENDGTVLVERSEAEAHIRSAVLAAEAGEPSGWREALKFYADRCHFMLSNANAWDTVSGEPANFWCDEDGTATVEDGSVAAMALAGTPLSDEGEEAAPPSPSPAAAQVQEADSTPSAAPMAVADPSAAKRVAEILQSRIGSSRDHSGLRDDDVALWDLCQSVIDDNGMSAEEMDRVFFEVSKVYNHVSGGLLSYPTYEASVVIAEAERVTNEWVEECLKEDREDREVAERQPLTPDQANNVWRRWVAAGHVRCDWLSLLRLTEAAHGIPASGEAKSHE